MVEIIHTATLVHDDVIDDAEHAGDGLRRYACWENHTRVWLEIWLYMEAFRSRCASGISTPPRDPLIGLTQMMVEGELLQLERIGRIEITEVDCMELVDRKTACLFSRSRQAGRLGIRSRF